MADRRKPRSFTRFRRPRQRQHSSKPTAKSPAEDMPNFSYLVEEGVLEQGKEREIYYTFVADLADDATQFGKEVNAFPYLCNTRGSTGALLFRLTNEINHFQFEIGKVERELNSLDFGPKEFAILEVVLRIARDRFDDMSKPGELRSCVERLVSTSVLHPLQARKDRATLTNAREGLMEAREFSANCRIGLIREHKEQGKLDKIEANVREVTLPAGQLKTPKS